MSSAANLFISQGTIALQAFGVLLGITAFFAIASAALLVGVATTTDKDVKDKHYDPRLILVTLAAFVGSVFAPLIRLFNALRSFAYRIFSSIVSNPITAITIILSVIFVSTYAIGAHEINYAIAFVTHNQLVAELYNLILFFILWFASVLNSIQPWINLITIQLPSTLISGLLFDLTSCTLETITAFIVALVRAWYEIPLSLTIWASQPIELRYLNPPDFSLFAFYLAQAISTFLTLFECICGLLGGLVAPFFDALTDGSPYDSGPPNFLVAVNASLAFIPVVYIDFARIFVFGGLQLQENGGTFNLSVLEAARPNFNSSFDTGLNVLNGTAGVADDIIDQYIFGLVEFIGTLSDEDVEYASSVLGMDVRSLQTSGFPPPPRFFQCIVSWLWSGAPGISRIVEISIFPSNFILRSPAFWKTALNALFNIDTVVTTFDGQQLLSFDYYASFLQDFIDCICAIIRWVGDLVIGIVGFIADEQSVPCGDGSSFFENVGICAFKIIGNFLKVVCCLIERYVKVIIQSFLLVWDVIIGSIYTWVTRGIFYDDDDSDIVCASPTPNLGFYCDIPKSPGVFLDYVQYLFGDRSDFTGIQVCPTPVCNLPVCESDVNCSQLSYNGNARRCNTDFNRCALDEDECSVFSTISTIQLPEVCIYEDDDDNAILSSCLSDGVCADVYERQFDADCICTPNIMRETLLLWVNFIDCIGQFFEDVFDASQTIRCFLNNAVLTIAEGFLIVIDFIVHLDVLFDGQYSFNDIDVSALYRAFRGLLSCIFNCNLDTDIPVIDNFVASICCLIDAAFIIVNAFIVLVGDIVNAIFGYSTWSFTSIERFVIDFFRAVIYIIAFLFRFIGNLIIPYGTGAYDTIQEFGIELKEKSFQLANDLITLIALFIECIVGIILSIFNFFNCLLSLGDECTSSPEDEDDGICIGNESLTCSNNGDCQCPQFEEIFTVLKPCWDLLLQLFFRILVIIGAEILCLVQYVWCFFTGQIIPGLETCDITQEECTATNIFCLIYETFCDFGISLDFIRDAFNCEDCGVRGYLCFLQDLLCILDLFVRDLLHDFEELVCSTYDDIVEVIPPVFGGFPTCYLGIQIPYGYINAIVTPEDCCPFFPGTEIVVPVDNTCADQRYVDMEISFEYCTLTIARGQGCFKDVESGVFCLDDLNVTFNGELVTCPDTIEVVPGLPFLDIELGECVLRSLPGACCDSIGFGQCKVVDNPLECTFGLAEGIWQGENTTCMPNLCPGAFPGACCNPLSGQCKIVDNPTECTFAGGLVDGVWQGDNTTCIPNLCPGAPTPQPTAQIGACCLFGFCSNTTESACINMQFTGTWQGGTDCSSVICPTVPTPPPTPFPPTPQPTFSFGACCLEAGGCSIAASQNVCEIPFTENVWQGSGTTCESVSCPAKTNSWIIGNTIFVNVNGSLVIGTFDRPSFVNTAISANDGHFTTQQILDASIPHSKLPFCNIIFDKYVNETWPPDTAILADDTLEKYKKIQSLVCINYFKNLVQSREVAASLGSHVKSRSIFQEFLPANLAWGITYPLKVFAEVSAMYMKHADFTGGQNSSKLLNVASQRAEGSIFGTDVFCSQQPYQKSLDSAYVADMLAPTVGRLLQMTLNSFYNGIVAVSNDQDDRTKPLAESIVRLTRNVHGLSMKLYNSGAISTIVQSIQAKTLSMASTMASIPGSTVNTATQIMSDTFGRISMQSRTRLTSLTRTRNNTLVPSMTISEAIASAQQRLLFAPVNTKLRLSPKFVLSTLPKPTASNCSIREYPFECCEDQNFCLECSVLDRLIYATQKSLERMDEYYNGDFADRFVPCINESFVTNHSSDVLDDVRCPTSVCQLIECTRDEQCVQSQAAYSGISSYCHPVLGRCVHDGDTINQCNSNTGQLCVQEVTSNTCSLRSCQNDTCSGSPINSFPCDCQCPDTYLTQEKQVETILTRFLTINWPWNWNWTHVSECLVPTSNFSQTGTIPDNHAYSGSVEEGYLCAEGNRNVPCLFIKGMNSTSEGLGSDIVGVGEDFLYILSQLGQELGEGGAVRRFLNKFVFCDYDADYYCPLTNNSQSFEEGCCDDRCEERQQGSTLFDGIFLSIFIAIALGFLVSVCCPFLPIGSLVSIIVLVAFVPLTLAIAYGGGILCYTSSSLLLLVPIFYYIIRFVISACSICAPRIFVNCFSVTLAVLGMVITVMLIFPGNSVCFGPDLYQLTKEIRPPCYPVPVELVDRSDPFANITCTSTFESSVEQFPQRVNCITTELLGNAQFFDVIDTALYTSVEYDLPAINDTLQFISVGELDFIEERSQNYDLEAHEQPITEACYYETLGYVIRDPLIILAILLAIVLLAAAVYAFLAGIILPLILGWMAVYLAWDQIEKMFEEKDTKSKLE